MAKIVEEAVVVKISKIVRDTDEAGHLIPDNFIEAIEAMAQELLEDPKAIVEVVQA